MPLENTIDEGFQIRAIFTIYLQYYPDTRF